MIIIIILYSMYLMLSLEHLIRLKRIYWHILKYCTHPLHACYTLLHQVDYVIHGRTPIKPCPDGSDPYQVNTHTHYMCSVHMSSIIVLGGS